MFTVRPSSFTVYPSANPTPGIRTAYDDGRSQLLLCLHGLLPIAFRGASYNIPIAVWVPLEYPRTPPLAYVVPTSDMLVRAGPDMDPSGRSFVHYVRNWERKSEVRVHRRRPIRRREIFFLLLFCRSPTAVHVPGLPSGRAVRGNAGRVLARAARVREAQTGDHTPNAAGPQPRNDPFEREPERLLAPSAPTAPGRSAASCCRPRDAAVVVRRARRRPPSIAREARRARSSDRHAPVLAKHVRAARPHRR